MTCRGLCKGDRSALESPARIGMRGGRRVVYCSCCGSELRRLDEWTRTADGIAIPARPPNLNRALNADAARFTDDACGYDHVLLAHITAAS